MNGSVAKRPNGRWRARYRDPSGREHARHFPRKADASAWLAEQTTMMTTGVYASPRAGRVSLGAFYAQWAARQVWAPNYGLAVDLAVRDSGLGDVALGALRRSHIETWIKRMDTRGLEPSTIAARVANLRTVLRAAMRDKMIPADPADGVKLPPQRRRALAMTIPTSAEVRALLAAADAFAPAVALAAFAGLRAAEIGGLQVGDVGWLTRTVDVRRQVQRAGGGAPDIRPPKAGSERTIHVPEALVTMLSAHVAEHRPGTDAARWLLVGRDGERALTADTMRKPWNATRRAAGVTEYRLHDLRHFYASGLIAAGCDVVTVQRAMGHSSATITLDTYSHLWPDADDRVRSAATGLMAQALDTDADPARTAGR